MSMLDIHNDAINTVNEAYHSLLLKYRTDKRIVYGIVEGKEDPIFYRSFIESAIPSDWKVELIPAGNKNKVIGAHDAVNWSTYRREQVVFFVDRDLGDFTGYLSIKEKNIYVTDGYSIENDIATESVAERLLIEAFNITRLSNDEKSRIISLFSSNAAEFKRLMTPLMAQILGWRRDTVKANLNNVNLSCLFKFDGVNIIKAEEYKDDSCAISYLSKCVGAHQYTENNISALKLLFVNADGPSRFTRGKYLMWFMAKALTAIHSNINNISKSYTTIPKKTVDVSPGNIMFHAAPRARIPDSLKKFIEDTFLDYIESIKVNSNPDYYI